MIQSRQPNLAVFECEESDRLEIRSLTDSKPGAWEARNLESDRRLKTGSLTGSAWEQWGEQRRGCDPEPRHALREEHRVQTEWQQQQQQRQHCGPGVLLRQHFQRVSGPAHPPSGVGGGLPDDAGGSRRSGRGAATGGDDRVFSVSGLGYRYSFYDPGGSLFPLRVGNPVPFPFL